MVVLRISISCAVVGFGFVFVFVRVCVCVYVNMLIDMGINNKFRLKILLYVPPWTYALRLLHACTRKVISECACARTHRLCREIIMYSRHVFTLPFRNENILLYRMSLEGKFVPIYMNAACECHLPSPRFLHRFWFDVIERNKIQILLTENAPSWNWRCGFTSLEVSNGVTKWVCVYVRKTSCINKMEKFTKASRMRIKWAKRNCHIAFRALFQLKR